MYTKRTPTSVGVCRQKVTIMVNWDALVDRIAAAADSALSQQVDLAAGVDVEDCDSERLTLSAEYETPYSEYPAEDGTNVVVRGTEFLDERMFHRLLAERLTTAVAELVAADIEEDANQVSFS